MSESTRFAAEKSRAVARSDEAEGTSRNQQRLFRRGPQPTTTGQLLLEVALFAAENMAFSQGNEATAAGRAREHLIRIRALADLRLAELSETGEND